MKEQYAGAGKRSRASLLPEGLQWCLFLVRTPSHAARVKWVSPLGGASSRGDCWRNLAFKQSCRDRRHLIPADPKGFMSGYELKLHV
jgi:hypothetical protein